MKKHHFGQYITMSIMLWSFPYLLWQAFGHWSGFLVGLIISVILTTMFNSLYRQIGMHAYNQLKCHF